MIQNELQLISAKQFKERYAPDLSVNTIYELFAQPDFPSVKIKQRKFTTPKAAEKWLSTLGRED